MLAVLIRLEGTLATASVPAGGASAALQALVALGVPLVVAGDREYAALSPAITAIVPASAYASGATLGAPPFSARGLRALGDQLQIPLRRIHVLSADPMDIAAATVASMPTIHVGGDPDAPRSVPDLAAAVEQLRGPYARAALELRAVVEGFHARRRARRAAESSRASER